jgi:hypothetical protein
MEVPNAERGDRAHNALLLSTPHPRREPPDDRPGGKGHERVTRIHRLRELGRDRGGEVNLHALVLEGTDQPVVLSSYEREVGRLVALPVPALLGIDESLHFRIPAVRADPLQLFTRAAQQNRAEPSHLAVRTPPRAPDPL